MPGTNEKHLDRYGSLKLGDHVVSFSSNLGGVFILEDILEGFCKDECQGKTRIRTIVKGYIRRESWGNGKPLGTNGKSLKCVHIRSLRKAYKEDFLERLSEVTEELEILSRIVDSLPSKKEIGL